MNRRPEQTFDVRTLEHKLRRRELTRAEVREYLAALPDEGEQGMPSDVRFNNPFEQRQSEQSDESDSADGN